MVICLIRQNKPHANFTQRWDEIEIKHVLSLIGFQLSLDLSDGFFYLFLIIVGFVSNAFSLLKCGDGKCA